MSVGKSVSLVFGISFLWIFVLGCEGDPGRTGPSGFNGPDGPDGGNYVPPPIADQIIGLMIVNSSTADFNGAAKIAVTSDPTATPGATIIVAAELESAPVIDGRSSINGEWEAAPLSTIPLANLFGNDNGITTAQVRLGYTRDYVFMQVRWTEVVGGSFFAVADTMSQTWNYDGTQWAQSGGDDRLYLAWEATPISGWETNGVASIFDGTTFKTPSVGERADLWLWSATQTYYSGTTADKNVAFSASNGERADIGLQYVIENLSDGGSPSFMLVNSTPQGSAYPLRSFEYGPFSNSLAWDTGAMIPGVITLQPSGSAADVRSAASFTNGTWTVELRRLRNTGHYDDLAL